MAVFPAVEQQYEIARAVVNNVDATIVGTVTPGSGNIITPVTQAVGTVVYGPFYNAKVALRLAIGISDVNSTGTLTVTIQGVDNSSGRTWNVLSSTALNAAGLTRLTVGPYIAASANAIAQDYAPVLYQVSCVVATNPVVFTIGAHGIGG